MIREKVLGPEHPHTEDNRAHAAGSTFRSVLRGDGWSAEAQRTHCGGIL
jgi:hypothetical protein